MASVLDLIKKCMELEQLLYDEETDIRKGMQGDLLAPYLKLVERDRDALDNLKKLLTAMDYEP